MKSIPIGNKFSYRKVPLVPFNGHSCKKVSFTSNEVRSYVWDKLQISLPIGPICLVLYSKIKK